MTTFPRNLPDNNLFGHVTAKFTYLTKIREFRVFSALKFNSSTPSCEKSSASRISANPIICTQLILKTYKKLEIRSLLTLENWYPVSERRNKYCLSEIQTKIYIYCFYRDINTLLQSSCKIRARHVGPTRLRPHKKQGSHVQTR